MQDKNDGSRIDTDIFIQINFIQFCLQLSTLSEGEIDNVCHEDKASDAMRKPEYSVNNLFKVSNRK